MKLKICPMLCLLLLIVKSVNPIRLNLMLPINLFEHAKLVPPWPLLPLPVLRLKIKEKIFFLLPGIVRQILLSSFSLSLSLLRSTTFSENLLKTMYYLFLSLFFLLLLYLAIYKFLNLTFLLTQKSPLIYFLSLLLFLSSNSLNDYFIFIKKILSVSLIMQMMPDIPFLSSFLRKFPFL